MPNRKKLGLSIAVFFAFLGLFSILAPAINNAPQVTRDFVALVNNYSPLKNNNPVDIAVQETVGETKTIEILPTWDTSVAEGDPTSESDRWDSTGIWIGGGKFDSGKERWRQRALLNFDLVQIPNQAIINKVTLKLLVGATTTGGPDFNMLISRITNPYNNGYTGIKWESTQHLEVLNSVNSGPVDSHWPRTSVDSFDITPLFTSPYGSDITLFLKDVNEQVSGGTHNQRGFWSKECHTDGCVKPSLTIEYTEPNHVSPKGYLDGVSSTVVAGGWACDLDSPNTPIEVHLYADKPVGQDGSVFLGNYVASNNRPDLAELCGGTTNHGYNITLDQIKENKTHLMDGNMHPIHVYAINYNSQGQPSDENQNPYLEHSAGVWANRNFVTLQNLKVIDVIKNPSFENELDWVVSPSDYEYKIIQDYKPQKDIYPLFGSKLGFIYSKNAKQVTLNQSFTVPANLVNPRIVYFYNLDQPDVGGDACEQNEYGSRVWLNNDLNSGHFYPSCKGSGTKGWVKGEVNVNQYLGQQVTLWFGVNPWGNGIQTFAIDGVYLVADEISKPVITDTTLPVCGDITFTQLNDHGMVKITAKASDNESGLIRGGLYVGTVPNTNNADFGAIPNDYTFGPQKEGLIEHNWNTANLTPGKYAVAANWWDNSGTGNTGGHVGNFVQCRSEYVVDKADEDGGSVGEDDGYSTCIDLDKDNNCTPDIFDLLALLDVVLNPGIAFDSNFDINQDSKIDVFDLIKFIDLYITN